MKVSNTLFYQKPSPKACNSGKDIDWAVINDWFPRIPNIKSMRLSEAVLDPVFLDKGITKNIPRQITFEVLDSQDRINRYIRHQTRRLWLAKVQGKPRLFFRIAKYLMMNSISFYLVCLHQVAPTWYKDLSLRVVMRLRSRYLKAIHNHKYHISRVYIPKKETFRPLGVPSLVTRLVWAGAAKIMQLWLIDYINPHQHGYMPGKGVITAWREVIGFVLPAKYIYEFDLKNFFGEVNKASLMMTLLVGGKMDIKMRDGVEDPEWFWEFIEHYLNTQPALPKEPQIKPKVEGLAALVMAGLSKAVKGTEAEKFFKPGISGAAHMRAVNKGVPQGGNLSPILSLVMLENLFKYAEHFGLKLVMFADDGILYGDKPIEPHLKEIFNPFMEFLGIKINYDKSQHVKTDGNWVNALKFLGLTYVPWWDKLMASTRNGSTLTFDKEDLLDAVAAAYPDRAVSPGSVKHILPSTPWGLKWTKFIQSSVMSFVVSRMYMGDWNPMESIRTSYLRYKESSWVNKVGIKVNDMNLHNASSFAYASLRMLYKSRNLFWYNSLNKVITVHHDPFRNAIGIKTRLIKRKLSNIFAMRDILIKALPAPPELKMLPAPRSWTGLTMIRKYESNTWYALEPGQKLPPRLKKSPPRKRRWTPGKKWKAPTVWREKVNYVYCPPLPEIPSTE